MNWILDLLSKIAIEFTYGFIFALGLSITSQGIMEYLDWQKWDRRNIEDLKLYSVKIGLGLSICIVFFKLYFLK